MHDATRPQMQTAAMRRSDRTTASNLPPFLVPERGHNRPMRLETERARRWVALALWALTLGCATERMPRRPKPDGLPREGNQVAGPTCPTYSAPVFPNTGEACPGTDATTTALPPVCVPAAARGHERTRDESPGVRVFEACEPRVTDEDRPTGTVDRRRVLIERSGDRPATVAELQEVTRGSYDWSISIWTQVDGIGPCPLSQGSDPDGAPQSCLLARSTDRNVQDIAASFAKALARHPGLCIPIVVVVGVPEGCIRQVRELSGP
jgi:hypothetical protein